MLIIVSNSNIPLWVREKVVVSVEHFVVAMGHAFLLVLTRPSAHNKNFPYHVRTTQIGIMQVRALFCFETATRFVRALPPWCQVTN